MEHPQNRVTVEDSVTGVLLNWYHNTKYSGKTSKGHELTLATTMLTSQMTQLASRTEDNGNRRYNTMVPRYTGTTVHNGIQETGTVVRNRQT